jgi:aspartyl/asparaginyl beta-hydroxylase (cupin superfamily)
MNATKPSAHRATIMDLETGISMPTSDAMVGLTASDRAVREEILHRAYAIWERDGWPENRRLAHWLEAEADVLRRIGAADAAESASRVPAPPVRPSGGFRRRR